jgi:programmed cell death protein 5
MDELEAIRARKLQQLQQMQQQQTAQQEMQKQQQMQEALRQIDSIVSRLLTPKAQDRLANLKMVDPELVQKLKIYLAQMYAAGQLKSMDDDQLKAILMKLKATQKDITIKRLGK